MTRLALCGQDGNDQTDEERNRDHDQREDHGQRLAWLSQRIVTIASCRAQRDVLLRDIIAKMRHDGCGGRPGKVELLTGIEGASSRPVRKIALRAG